MILIPATPNPAPLRAPTGSRLRPVVPCLLAVYSVLTLAGLLLVWLRGGAEAIPDLVLGPGAVFSASAGLAVAAVTILGSELGARRLRWMRRLARVVRRLFGALTVSEAITIGLLTGIGEEVFFRGGLQPILGLVATSLIFGALHVLPPLSRNWPWMVFAGALGFALGWIYRYSGSLVGPVAAHVVINAVNLARMGRMGRVG